MDNKQSMQFKMSMHIGELSMASRSFEHGSIGADTFLGEVRKEEVRGTDVGWDRSALDRAFQADLLLAVALLTVIPVNSRWRAVEIPPTSYSQR